MTYRPNDLGDVDIGQAEFNIQEMLHREFYGLPHQKAVFARGEHVQEDRKTRMPALIDGLDPLPNRRSVHLQALDMDKPLFMPPVSGQSDLSTATEYFCPRFIMIPRAFIVDLSDRIFCNIRHFGQSNRRM